MFFNKDLRQIHVQMPDSLNSTTKNLEDSASTTKEKEE